MDELNAHPYCPACQSEAAVSGFIRHCAPPDRPVWRLERWSMTPDEWAGEPPRRERD